MDGIIFCVCSTSAISALLLTPLQLQNELNKNQEKNVSQQDRDLWWIWPRGCLRSCLLQLHQSRGWLRMDIKIMENLLQVTIDRGNLRNRHHQQKQQWTRNGKNWRKCRRGIWQKSKVRNRWSRKQGRRAQKFILHNWWTYVIWKMLNWRQNTRNTKVELFSAVIL